MPALNSRFLKTNIIEPIQTGGSAREFYRCRYFNKTAILIIDREIKKYRRIHRHLFKNHVDVPKFYWTDNRRAALFEDLGKKPLAMLLNKDPRIYYYRKVINMLVRMQNNCSKRPPIIEHYDRRHIKWEQNYFKKFFLEQYCRIKQKELGAAKKEFDALTDQVLRSIHKQSNYFMHRDFQSQNIYIKNKKTYLIDFQSARIGPPTYDLSSLLRDPYADITVEQEKRLLDYYFDLIKNRRNSMSYERLTKMYRLTCIQRNMQALGAYANLSLNKGKRHFLKYIPRGRRLLMRGLREGNFKQLLEITKRCRGAGVKR